MPYYNIVVWQHGIIYTYIYILSLYHTIVIWQYDPVTPSQAGGEFRFRLAGRDRLVFGKGTILAKLVVFGAKENILAGAFVRPKISMNFWWVSSFFWDCNWQEIGWWGDDLVTEMGSCFGWLMDMLTNCNYPNSAQWTPGRAREVETRMHWRGTIFMTNIAIGRWCTHDGPMGKCTDFPQGLKIAGWA